MFTMSGEFKGKNPRTRIVVQTERMSSRDEKGKDWGTGGTGDRHPPALNGKNFPSTHNGNVFEEESFGGRLVGLSVHL